MNGNYTTYRNRNNDLLTIFSGAECYKPKPNIEDLHFETFVADQFSMTDTNHETLADLLNHLTNWQKTDEYDSYLGYKIASNKDLKLADVFKLIETELDDLGYYAKFISMFRQPQSDSNNVRYFIDNYTNNQEKCIIGLAYISKENAAKHNSPRDIVLKHINVYLRNYSGWSNDETYSYEYESHTGVENNCPGFMIIGGPMTYANNSTYKLKEPILCDLEKHIGENVPNLWKEVKLVQAYQRWEDVV